MLLAFDDTDSREGGCTTRLLLDVLASLEGVVLRGLPRLVRLNPNVPWKTRGNAAVCVDLGLERGPMVRCGEWRGHEMRAYPEASRIETDAQLVRRAWDVVSASAQEGAQPGIVACQELPAAVYHQAVQTRLDVDAVQALLEASGAVWHGGRGIVGAAAAVAWPGPPTSFELTAYREPKAWGTPRQMDVRRLRGLDATGATFHSWDLDEDRPTFLPRTPCPVLCGLRGRDPDVLRTVATRALSGATLEPIDAWILWATNQASGDHVVKVPDLAAPPWATLQVPLRVMEAGRNLEGGRTSATCEDALGRQTSIVAFEPTHAFRRVVEALRPGDRVTAVGPMGERGINLEKLRVDEAVPLRHRVNPMCPCGRRMKSRGASAGFACACGQKAPWEAATWVEETRKQLEGWHEVPVMARRHLHRPLAWDSSPRLW